MTDIKKLNIQTDGVMEKDVKLGKKVKLHEHLTKEEIEALMERKRKELEEKK